MEKEQPLAARMRPRTLAEFVGQDRIMGPGRLLRRAIQVDQLSSLLFYGPPGTGKTTLARVIANTTRSHFITINAVLAGVKEIRQATGEASERYKLYGQRTILFVDEVHRWNKAQQDGLLPWVENGTIILIGATTENPYFEVNRALVSRSRIFQLTPLTLDDLHTIARRTLADEERGYGRFDVRIDEDALAHLADVSNGDARTLLNALELAVETTPAHFPPAGHEPIHITLEIAEESIQQRVVLYDKEGDYHFDTISAFIKSLRGSDPDAALYWLAKMVYAGENPRFIFRRMLIFASEDVGLADPHALPVVEAAASAFDRVGLPEGRFHLAQAVLYLATAPKSNSSFAFFDALNVVEKEQDGEVPVHLKDGGRDREGFGHGEGYLYPHSYREHWVAQQYLPDRLQGKVFYQPGNQGYEASIGEQVKRRREAQLEAMLETEKTFEVLSFTRANRARDLWLERTVSRTGEHLAEIRELIIKPLKLERHHLVMDINAGGGLLCWEALRQVPEGGVWTLAGSRQEAESLRRQAEELPEPERPTVLEGRLEDLSASIADSGLVFDAALGRNGLLKKEDRAGCFAVIKELLKPGGKISLAEIIPALGTRLTELVNIDSIEAGVVKRIKEAENRIYGNPDDEDILKACRAAGLKVISSQVRKYAVKRLIRPEDIERWFSREKKGERPSYALLLAGRLGWDEVSQLEKLCADQLAGREVTWSQAHLFLAAEKGFP